MKKWIILLTIVAALSISLTAIAATGVASNNKATPTSPPSQSTTLKVASQSHPVQLSSTSTVEPDNEAKSTVDNDNIQQQVGPNVEQKGGPNNGPDTPNSTPDTNETSSAED